MFGIPFVSLVTCYIFVFKSEPVPMTGNVLEHLKPSRDMDDSWVSTYALYIRTKPHTSMLRFNSVLPALVMVVVPGR